MTSRGCNVFIAQVNEMYASSFMQTWQCVLLLEEKVLTSTSVVRVWESYIQYTAILKALDQDIGSLLYCISKQPCDTLLYIQKT